MPRNVPILSSLRSRLARGTEADAPTRVDKHVLTEKLQGARESAERWKTISRQYRRRALSTNVIRYMLERRAGTLAARQRIPPAAEREAALRAASPAYCEALAAGPASFGRHAHPMTVQGLHWWMPVVKKAREGPREEWLIKQRFPYRVMTQTREVGIGGIMLDLGANVGRMSIPRVILGDVVAAYCAEPDPLNYACLVGNAVDNGLAGWVLPDRVAIGDRDGTVTLLRGGVSGAHRVVRAEAADEGERIEVPSVTLDSWLRRLQVDPDAITFVKVDVQGQEMNVLRGAPDLLARRHVAWQLELAPYLLTAAGTSFDELLDTFIRHFDYFIDISGEITGPRERPIKEIHDGLAYLREGQVHTDVLVF